MGCVILALPRLEDSRKIGELLRQQGYPADVTCVTGAEVLYEISKRDNGIVLCGSKLRDMSCVELAEYLPDYFDMLAMGPGDMLERFPIGVFKLVKPFKMADLTKTIDMLMAQQSRRIKRQRSKPENRTEEERATILQAKLILMDRNNMTEPEAYRYIQKSSMDSGTNIVETAQMIIMLNCD